MSILNRDIKTEGNGNVDSGTVKIEGDSIIYHNEDVVFLKLKLSDIVIVGEITNSNGPWFDDWFIVFVTKDNQWNRIPMFAKNMDELLLLLGETFDPSLKATVLANSTEWKWVVRFPKILEGKELFIVFPDEKQEEPKNWFQRLLYYLGLRNVTTTKQLNLSEDVSTYINQVALS